MPDIKGNNQKVYDFLSSKSVQGIGENADQFQQFMQKDENRRKVYDYLSSVKAQGIGNSYDEFSSLVYEAKPDYSFGGMSFNASRPSNYVEVAPEPKQEPAPAPVQKQPEYKPANFVESAPNVKEEVPAEPEEEKKPFTEEELLALRDQYQEDYRFKGEYEQKEKEYKDHMRSLQNIRGNVAGLDETLAKYKAEKQWLDENAARYQEASTNWRNVEGRSYDELVPAAKESLKAKMAENRQYMATPQETITGGRTPFEKDEKNLHEKANDIYSKAEQALNQGSKFDPGYDSGEVGAFLTAFRQYIQGGINNVDKDTLTMGLASGTAMAKARDVMEKNNGLVDEALKGMGMADGDVAALMSTITTDTNALNEIVSDLDQRKGELDSMEQTIKDMIASKADRSKIEAYTKEYDKKVAEYNDIIKKDYAKAKSSYDQHAEDYKKIEDAVAAALENGLSGGEKAILDAVQELTKANMLRANDVSTASQAGASFEQTLEFMLDFLLTKGLGRAGTKAATKLTARHLERKLGKEAFEYMAKREVIRPSVFARAAMDVPVSVARTAVMFPRTIKAYGEHATEYSGKDPMGRFELSRTKGESLGNAILEDFIEYYSEGFGEYFSAGEQALFRSATRNAPKTMIGQTLKAYQGSIGQFLDYGKFSGMLNEMLEEVAGSGMNALAGILSGNKYGDKDALKEFKDGLTTMTLSFLPLSAIGAATNISAYNRMKENYDKGVAGLEPFFKSGALSREELDNLAAGLHDLTPEEASKKIADMEKRAAEANHGALPNNFRDNIMGYLEGTFSMSLRNEEWENSKQKVEVATAYADTYNMQDVGDAYDLNEDEQLTRQAAVEAGFTEDELDKDAWQLSMDAANLAAEEDDRWQVLQSYAVAKGANKGLADGYKGNTEKMTRAYADAVTENVDVNGNVVTATVNVQGQDVPVFVLSPDATVNTDGTITTPTGPDGLVTYQIGLGGKLDEEGKTKTKTVKASQLSNAQSQATGEFIAQKQQDIETGRAKDFEVAQTTMSARGKAKAIAGLVGQQVYFERGGVFQPLKIERIRDNGQTVVVSGDRKALQGIARAMNIEIPAASMLEAPVTALYDNLAQEEDGSITTDVPAEKQQAVAEEVREEEAAPAEPAMDLSNVIDEDVDIELDGQKQKVHVLSVKNGTVTFSDETGQDRRMPESQFVTAMQGTQMPAAEAPAAEVQAEAPAAEVAAEQPVAAEVQRTPIPVDEKSGEKIYDAPGVAVQDALEDLYATEGLTEADVDQYIAERAAETEAARNPERGKMSPQAWGQAKKEAARVADFWSNMAKAAQERKAQPAAAEAAPAATAEEAPAAEAPVAETPAAEAPVAEQPAAPAQEAAPATEETQAEEPTKESLKPYKKMVSRAKKWQKRTGIKVRLCTSIDEVNDPQARAELEKGEKIAGWFDPETGGVGVYLPNISSEEQLDKTIVHEVVSHKGLKGMLGDEGYNALCDRVWKELMTRGDRAKYMRYVRHLSGTKEFLQRAAADEYIANLSENVDFSDNRNLFEKIVDYIAEWFKEKFGNESPLTEEEIIADAQARATDERRMTRRTLQNLLIDSMKLYEARTREGQDEANERREISANTGGSMETGKGKKNSTKFSIVSTVSGVGMNVIENDGTGRVAFEMPDGRRFDADHPITAEDISSMPDTVMSYMMEDAVEIAHLKPEAVQRIWQAYADQLNAFLRKGVPTNGMTGEQILKDLWEWEVENTVYRSVSPNGDKQYSYSIDITRVCKKNEAVIRAISSMQRKVGYGLTPGQIMDIYMEGVEEGYQVPCPVCYVFSHYINNGIVATVAINGQEKWGADLVDPATLSEEEKQARIQMWYDRLKKQGEENAANAKEIEAAKEDCKMIIEEINEISELVTSGRLTGKDRTEALRRVKVLDNRYRSAFEVLSQSGLTQWVKQFAIREAKKGETGFVPKGQPKGEEPKAYVLWEDTFQGFPKEYALDLRLTAETIEKYPAIQRMRNARGSAGGKEIHFASNNDIGDIPMMLGADNKDNYYQQAVKAQGAEREELRKKARERFASAHRYAQQQSLRGGQRMWSWSDNIERLAPDVFANLMQLQMLGGALQAYSKQLEGVNLVASMGGYVNGSLMGYGKGWQELRDDEVETLPDGGMVLAHDIMDPVTEKVDGKDVPRDRYLAKAGAPVFEIDGKKVTLLLDDVVGIDAYGRETEDGGHLKGLFDLNAELDKAGNIIVGMNDTHVRNAMADGRIFFIIPWHASGNSVHVVQQMLGYLGVKTNLKDYTDYTDVQEEKDLKGKDVSEYVARFWEDTFQNGGKDFACGIEEGIPSGKDGKLSPEQEHYRELRDAIFLGIKYDTLKTTKKGNKVYDTISVRDLINLVASVEAGEQEMPAWLKADPRELYKWAAQIQNDAFLSQALRKVEARVDEQKMTKTDTGFIYPYEYWDEQSTYDTADVNGTRYLEYCRRLGVKPKFVGMLDGRAPEKDFGNFAKDKGYWKLLIDRRMYDVNGRFQDLDPVTTNEYDPKFVDPQWTEQNFTKTQVADDEGAERIADKVIEREGATLPGGVPQANYSTDLKTAARKYRALTGMAKRPSINDLVAAATPEAVFGQNRDEGGTMMRRVEDQAKIEELEKGQKVKVYRSMQFVPNPGGDVEYDLGYGKGLQKGFLYAPMSAKVNGKWRDPIHLGEWEEAEENPDLADENGDFWLDKADGSEPMKVAYAPYLHTRLSPLNEQFSSAYKRGNLVIVESEVPESELKSGYTAEKSKKSTGEHDWPSGKVSNALAKEGMDTRKVILSRWAKPTRLVPTSEVADKIADLIGDRDIAFPYNVVTPGLRSELVKRGVKFDGWQGNKPKDVDELIAKMKKENESAAGQTRFRKAQPSEAPIFLSNAAQALGRIKMEKATPEQWTKMLEKEGGLKAGEDKWIGLSDWLNSSDRKTLTKQEIADYIAQNQILIGEYNYAEDKDVLAKSLEQDMPGFFSAFSVDSNDFSGYEYIDGIINEPLAIELYNTWSGEEEIDPSKPLSEDDYKMVKKFAEEQFREGGTIRKIHPTRLHYTTEGLDNKREIALVVPTVESYEGDLPEIHFYDAGNGRAVAWVRFGETTTYNPGVPAAADEYREKRNALDEYRDSLKEKYADSEQPYYKACTPEELEKLDALKAEEKEAWDKLTDLEEDRKKVLVIDEVQSQRHEDARKIDSKTEQPRGYKEKGIRDKATDARADAWRRWEDAKKAQNEFLTDVFGENYDAETGSVPAEYVEAHPLTAEQMGRLGELQNAVRDTKKKLDDAQESVNDAIDKEKNAVPAAPFEKNWHELAMKRMLRLAAEEGYDYLAWTSGDQQSQRYRGLAGREGMRGFYDDILPRFMNKYGKKWGVKVNDIQLPQVEKAGQTMHAVPVTPEMKESVMQGQTMFRRLTDEDRDEARQREQMDEGLHNTMANRGIELTKKDIAEGKKLSRENPGVKIRLGLPGGSLMAAGVRDQQIVISEYDLAEASGNGYGDKHSYHPFDLDDLKDLASLINHPIAVFRDQKNPHKRVLLLDRKGYNLDKKQSGKHDYIAVISSVPVYTDSGNIAKDSVVGNAYENKVLTIFPADGKLKSLYAHLKDLADGTDRVGDNVMWVDNKKISSWVKVHSTDVSTYDAITQKDIAKIQKDFENKQDLLRIDAENSRPGRNTRYRRVSEGDSKEARIESAEWDVTERNLDAMGQAFGVKVNRVSREDMPKGHKTEKGYFDPSTNELTICMDNVLDERDAMATMIHETVGRNGLRELFGDQFQQDMVNIYAALNPEGRTWVNAYIARNGLFPGDAAIVDGMIEYMANLAEKADPNDTVWNRINELLGKSVDIVYGTEGFEFTNRELAYVLRAANEYAKNPEWLNTTEGKAKDTLWKRELGINESDPDRPTDPDGPGAGTRYRRVETGNAVRDYEEEMKQTGTIIQMEFQDADLPVKIGVEKIMREKGRLTKDAKGNLVLEKLPDDEDYVTRHNQASSRADTEAKEYELFFFQPLLEKIKDIQRKLADGKTDAESMMDAYDRILDYLYAMSGLERNEWERAHGGEAKDWSGLTSLTGHPKEEWREAEADARKLIENFKKAVGDDALLDDLWDSIRACSDFTLDHAYKYELLTKKEYEELRGTKDKPRMWEYYLPLRGFKGGTVEDEYNYSSFKNGTNGTEVNKEAKGRWTEAENPIANLYHIALSEIVQGNENWSKQALYNFLLDVGDNSLLEIVNPWYMEDVSTGNWVPVYPNPNESYKDFEERMQEERKKGKAIQPKKHLKLDKPMANPIHKQEHIIKLKIGGQDRSIMVKGNNAIARAVQHNWKTNYQNLRRASRVISNLFTTYSINFSGKNLFRDTIYSMVSRYIKEDKAYRKAYRKNWWKNFGHGAFAYPMVRLAKQWEDGTLQQKQNPTQREQAFMDFMRDGGQTGYTIVQKVQDITRNIEREMKYAGKKRAFRNEQGQVSIPILSHFAELVSTLNEGFELLTRFTTYQTSREMGRTGQRSASDAKEVSVNFNRRGMQSGEGFWGNAAAWFGASHYFFNASVQGFENFLRLFKIDRPKMTGITAGFALLGMATPFINSMIEAAFGGDDGDDDWYWNIPDWVRRNNIIIGGHKFYLAIPLPVELRAFYGIGDLIAKAFPYNKMADRTAGHVMLELLNTLGEVLPVNPVEGSQQIKDIGDWKKMLEVSGRILLPDITTFAIDFATNSNYTGTPLAKENPFSGTTPRSQGAFASTPKALEDACMWLAMHTGADFPPGYVRDFLNSFGGGLYRTAEDLAKILYRDEERPFRWDNIPFFSGFMGHIDQDRSNAHALEVLQEYGEVQDKMVRDINKKTGMSFTTSDVYDDPEALLQSLKPSRQAVVKRIMDSPEFRIGQTYREYMNNKYKMVQYTRGPKIGQWHESNKEIERVGINKLKENWKAARSEWYSLPKGSPEKAEAYADLQTAWQKYYDATMDLAEKLMDIEFDRK